MPDGQIIRHSEIALSRIEAIQKFKLPETRDSDRRGQNTRGTVHERT